jgi:hypothetical protein
MEHNSETYSKISKKVLTSSKLCIIFIQVIDPAPNNDKMVGQISSAKERTCSNG